MIMLGNEEDEADLEIRIAAVKRNITLQTRLIETLVARNQSVTVAARMLLRLEARLSKLELSRGSRPDRSQTGRAKWRDTE